jgi:hypothetical protein
VRIGTEPDCDTRSQRQIVATTVQSLNAGQRQALFGSDEVITEETQMVMHYQKPH